MSNETPMLVTPNWRAELPTLAARLVTLREPASSDLRPLMDLLFTPRPQPIPAQYGQ